MALPTKMSLADPAHSKSMVHAKLPDLKHSLPLFLAQLSLLLARFRLLLVSRPSESCLPDNYASLFSLPFLKLWTAVAPRFRERSLFFTFFSIF